MTTNLAFLLEKIRFHSFKVKKKQPENSELSWKILKLLLLQDSDGKNCETNFKK
jgi:hypothetical protein